MRKKIALISIAIILFILFLMHISYEYPHTGRYAMKTLDSLTLERKKLDSLLQMEQIDDEIKNKQVIIVYSLLKKRIESEKGLKLIKQRDKDFLKQLQPIIEKLERKKINNNKKK